VVIFERNKNYKLNARCLLKDINFLFKKMHSLKQLFFKTTCLWQRTEFKMIIVIKNYWLIALLFISFSKKIFIHSPHICDDLNFLFEVIALIISETHQIISSCAFVWVVTSSFKTYMSHYFFICTWLSCWAPIFIKRHTILS